MIRGAGLGCLAVLVGAAGLRLYGLGRWSLEGDEIYSWYDVQGLLTGGDWRPGVRTAPLGYLAMAAAVALGGLGEFALRSVSALAGTLAVLSLMVLRRDVVPRGVGQAAGALAALSPWLLYHAQSARFYGPLLLCASLATLWLLPGPGRRPLPALLAWVAAVLCHPTGLLLAPGLVLPLLLSTRGRRQALVVVLGLVAVVIAVLLLDDGTVTGVFWRVIEGADPGHYDVAHLLLGLGYNLGPFVGLLAAAGLATLVVRERALTFVLAGCAVLPPVVLVAAGLLGLSMHQRYAMAAVPAALLLAGFGIAAARARAPSLGVLAAALALAAYLPGLLAHVQDGSRHDTRAVAAWIAANARDPEALFVFDEHATIDLYLHAHPGFADIESEEDPLDARRRYSWVRHRKDCWVALKVSRLGSYDAEFEAWVDSYFKEVARIGREPMPLVRHDNRYVIYHRKERVR